MATTLNRDQLFLFAKNHRQEYEELLKRFVETPTVSVDPAHAEDIRAGLGPIESKNADPVTVHFPPDHCPGRCCRHSAHIGDFLANSKRRENDGEDRNFRQD